MISLKPASEERTSRSTASDLGGWILRCGLALFFIVMGLEKIPADPAAPWVRIFEQIGLGQWFRYFTAAIEIVGGLLYVFPRTLMLGAMLLGSTMVGAMVVHIVVRHSIGSSLFPAAILLGIIAIALREPD